MIAEQGELGGIGAVESPAPEPVPASKAGGKVLATGYLEPYAFYVERFGKGIRTIKRWAGERAPLDDAQAMVGWWSRVHAAQRVPAGILEAVDRLKIDAVKAPEAPAAAAEPRQDESMAPPADESSSAEEAAAIEEGEMGLERAFDRLCRLEVLLARDYAEPGRARDYVSTVSRLTNTAKALRLELAELGELVPKNEAAAAVVQYGQAIGREADGLFEVMCQLLEVPPNSTTREKWLEATKEFRVRLGKEVFPS